MTKLGELSKISNAVLTPHLNCDLSLITHNDTNTVYKKTGNLTDYELRCRIRWCEKQMREIGSYGVVLCG